MGDGELAVQQFDRAGAHYGGEGLGIGGPEQQSAVLEEIAHADSGDEHGQGGRLAQRLIGQPFDDHAQDGAHYHGQQHAGQSRDHGAGQRALLKAAGQAAHGEKTDICPHHNDVSVGKVQHFGNTVDHRIAQGNDGRTRCPD